MKPKKGFEVTLLSEAFLTLTTVIRLLPYVNELVIVERMFPSELFPTFRTWERFNFSVNKVMLIKIALVPKRFHVF